MLQGASHQRCRVHVARNLLPSCPRATRTGRGNVVAPTGHPTSDQAGGGDYCSTVPEQPESAPTPVPPAQPTVPDAIARILAAAVVSTIIGAAVTKLFGKKAGFVAFVISASAHEMFDAPLARRFSTLGL